MWQKQKLGSEKLKQYESMHDKTNKMMCSQQRPINLFIRLVWSKSSLSAWRNLGSLATYVVQSEYSNEAGWMSWLFWVFAVVTGLYAPNFFEVDGAYRFRVVASVWPEPCMLGFWNFIYGFLTEKYLTHFFFSCPSYLLFWSYAPFEKIRMKSDACHILWTVHARVLKFRIWIPHGKTADQYFFLVQVISLSGVMPLWKKSEWNLVSKISRKVFELGAWNLVSW